MKRKFLLVLAAIVLGIAIAGVAQGAPAHEPMKGAKLVGIGDLGSVTQVGYDKVIGRDTRFEITNPDCVNDITIEGLSIIRSDGTVIYEGPLYKVTCNHDVGPPPWVDLNDVDSRVEVTTLGPHEQVRIILGLWRPDGGGGWLSHQQAVTTLFLNSYTVEISYRTSRKGLDLIGRGDTHGSVFFIPSGHTELESWSVPMVNMKQK